VIDIKFTTDEAWDDMISRSIEASNERLTIPFVRTFELYAFQKGFEACAELLKQQVKKNINFKPDENRPDLG